jgi:site-specific DNA recombinase
LSLMRCHTTRLPWEAGGRVDFASEHDEQAMTHLGQSSKRKVTRNIIRVLTAMAAQTREQGRYLGGAPAVRVPSR